MKAAMDPTTLYVRHLPSELSPADREELLRLVGAVQIRIMPDDRKMKHSAFATFQTHQDAKHALSILHQREILGHCLTVEFAKKRQVPPMGTSPMSVKEEAPEPSRKEVVRSDMEEFSKGLHGIAPVLGIDYLPSPMLRYKYPPPTATVIQNIGNALASCPKFYTQVLHLMNKMNLPAPFGPPTPAPPLAADEKEEEEMVVSEEEEESEYESESEEKKEEPVAVGKRPLAKPKVKRKRRKLADLVPVVVDPASREKTEPSEVFESQPLSQKKISLKIDPTALPTTTTKSEEEPAGGFGAFGGTTASEEDASNRQQVVAPDDDWHDSRFISLDELRRKRISSREMRTMSIFRNYSPGEPTLRLYIKNLAKQVVEKDLRHIFGRFVDSNSEKEREMFDVKLMKEGRMKGQAFVTLASERQAAEAVKETNGFVLHTKPLVVHFARSAKPKDGK